MGAELCLLHNEILDMGIGTFVKIEKHLMAQNSFSSK
jgi:hypothetical protein